MWTPDEQLTKGEHIFGAPRKRLGARLRAEYERGARVRWLSEDIGRSYGFVHRLLAESGTTFRRPGGDVRAARARAARRHRIERPEPAHDGVPDRWGKDIEREIKAAPRVPLDPATVAELRRKAGLAE